MRTIVRNILLVCLLLSCCIQISFADGRPRIHELNDKKQEILEAGVVPAKKKDEWGYATRDGKFLIPAVFTAAMPVNSKQVAFVSYINKEGRTVWTPISLKGAYLTDQEFTHVVKDFDEKGLAIVQQDGRYGVVNHLGKMVAMCSYSNCYDYGAAYLLKSSRSLGCVAVVKEDSQKGYGVYSFDADEPVILKTEKGCGIVSHRTLKVVADFGYESVKEIVSGSVYTLQKGGKKYLYADDKLSSGFDEIIPGPSKAYYVVKDNGVYGVLKPNNSFLLACSQTELPVLKKDEYTRFFVNGAPVYVNWSENISASRYDDLLFKKYRATPSEYLLEETLELGLKSHVSSALALSYGTKEFAKLDDFQPAIDYAQNRRYILLSQDYANAKYLDLTTGDLIDAGEVLYHAFPSKTGAPAYASALRSGKFGILDIRTKKVLLPFEYDKVTPLKNGYASLQKDDAFYLYKVADSLMITSHSCEVIEDDWLDLHCVVVKQEGKKRVYSLSQHKWLLPEDHTLESFVRIPDVDSLRRNLAAVMKKTGKKAMFSLQTGERLTDYLFDGVENELIGDKYNVVTVAGKKGLYDVGTKKYVLPSECTKLDGYHIYNNEEFIIITKADKQGVYNLSKNKVVLTAQNDAVDMRDGYVRIRRNGKYAVYSLQYNKMVFESPVEYVQLMNDGYALLQTPYMIEKGVYNLNWNEWSIDPMSGHDISFIGGDYIGVANRGVGNYKTNKLILRTDDEWAESFIEVIDNFVIMGDPIEGASMWIYKLDTPGYELSGSSIDVLTSTNTSIRGKNLAIVHKYQYDDGWNIVSVQHCKLQDLDSGRLILSDYVNGLKFNEMVYMEPGVVSVTMEGGQVWLYDVMTEKWLLKSRGKLECESTDYLYLTLTDSTKYLFDPYDRVLVKQADNYGLRDYQRFKAAKSLVPQKLHSQYDRISLMFEN